MPAWVTTWCSQTPPWPDVHHRSETRVVTSPRCPPSEMEESGRGVVRAGMKIRSAGLPWVKLKMVVVHPALCVPEAGAHVGRDLCGRSGEGERDEMGLVMV